MDGEGGSFKETSEMDHTSLTDLPIDIITNILSRLPIRSAISCKCVCKPWLQLVETPQFAKLHISKSIPGLIVYHNGKILSKLFRIFEFNDELGLQTHELHYVPVTEIKSSEFITHTRSNITIDGSANGLLFLRDKRTRRNALYICNPITREYIKLPNPKSNSYYTSVVTYGFGVSKKTDRYKVVRISHQCEQDLETDALLSISESECCVYTLGTRSWRNVPHYSSLEYKGDYSCGAFLNGNVHWLASDITESLLISCFDLETELFMSLSLPPSVPVPQVRTFMGDVAILGDHLCLCDDTSLDEFVVWVMKEYGVEKSWTKEFTFGKFPDLAGGFCSDDVYPIKIFMNGDILFFWGAFINIVYYSSKTKTIMDVDMLNPGMSNRVEARLHASSLLSLKSFKLENVVKF